MEAESLVDFRNNLRKGKGKESEMPKMGNRKNNPKTQYDQIEGKKS